MELTGKTIVVTGCTSGIGESCAEIIVSNGGYVVGICRDKSKADRLQSKLGKAIQILQVDLLNLEDIPSAFVNLKCKIDGLIHAAGVDCFIPLQIAEIEQYKQVMDLNFGSFAFLAKELSSKRHKTVNQSFVCISSVASHKGRPGATFYAASKGAIESFTKSLAVELSTKGVRVNSICPGFVETPLLKKLFNSLTLKQQDKIISQHPLGIGSPRDVAELCSFLLSDRSKWMTGSNIILDGGFTNS